MSCLMQFIAARMSSSHFIIDWNAVSPLAVPSFKNGTGSEGERAVGSSSNTSQDAGLLLALRASCLLIFVLSSSILTVSFCFVMFVFSIFLSPDELLAEQLVLRHMFFDHAHTPSSCCLSSLAS